jgi:hypothetical protein
MLIENRGTFIDMQFEAERTRKTEFGTAAGHDARDHY